VKLATSRYFHTESIGVSKLAPVGSTVGSPKYLSYPLAGMIGALAPHGIHGRVEDEDEFRRLYRERLEMFGVERLRELLEAFARTYNAPGVVLLCFCNLETQFCHRRMFAEWWEEQTGEDVPELERPDEQLSIPAQPTTP
jgi:uncharacterized protein DUF488